MCKQEVKHLINFLGYELIRKDSNVTLFNKDLEFSSLYEKAQKKTQMSSTDNILRRQRHYTLQKLIKNADLDGGAVCEIGCWRGLSAYQIAACLSSVHNPPIFYIFDSFEGLSDITAIDRYEYDKRDAASVRKQFACFLETVQRNLREFRFIKYYKGWVPQRFNEVEDKVFSFVHIDVDLYQPIHDAFEFFYPRLIQKGIMVFDDYGCLQFPGAKKAIDECLLKYKELFFLPLPSGQAFLIKGLMIKN